MKEKYTLEDIIDAQIKDALGSVAGGNPVPAAPTVSAGGSQFDINGITKLLGEINKLAGTMQARGASGGLGSDGLPLPGSAPALPASGGAGSNPRPVDGVAPAAADISKLDPERVYVGIRDTLGKLRATIGDVTLSEVEAFMESNRAVVVAMIGQELEAWSG